MSLTSLNVKITKGKQKTLPKLKIILANPYKSECSSLDLSDLETVKQLLCNEITKSGVLPRTYANSKNICIGLESVLRSINNARCSCIFISTNIRPRYVVHMIARNTELKNPTAQIYLVPQLEIKVEQIFGIRTLAFALPMVMEHLDIKLQEWIVSHQRMIIPKRRLKSETKRKETCKRKELQSTEEKKIVKNIENEKNPHCERSCGDYIPFNSMNEINKMSSSDLEADKNELLVSLGKMTAKIVAEEVQRKEKTDKNKNPKNDDLRGYPHSSIFTDNYLQVYQPLEVHKICSNPNRAKNERKK